MKKVAIISLFLLLTGCVSPPAGLEKDQFTLQQLKQITQQDYACQCKRVRFGGKVLSANALQGKTQIEVLSLPVANFSAKPVIDGNSDGRFIAYLNGFVDPATLQDQYITVAGTLVTQQQGKIDQADYRFPVINVDHYKQWKLVQEYYYDMDDFDYPYAFGGVFGRRWGGGIWYATPKVRYALY